MRRRPDNELIALARRGSTQAAEILFERYWVHAWQAAYAVLRDRSLADDAAQEAIAKAFGVLERFDETRPFGPWLKRIAINRAVDLLRRERREAHPLAPLEEAGGREAPSEGVAEAVAALASGKRLVIVLHYWLDLPLDEIAGVLGLPVGTVASRLARAKAELREVLEEDRVG